MMFVPLLNTRRRWRSTSRRAGSWRGCVLVDVSNAYVNRLRGPRLAAMVGKSRGEIELMTRALEEDERLEFARYWADYRQRHQAAGAR